MAVITEKVVCKNCGAVYDRLPAYTCPRCSAPLCKTGCDGCTAKCGFKAAEKTKRRTDDP